MTGETVAPERDDHIRIDVNELIVQLSDDFVPGYEAQTAIGKIEKPLLRDTQARERCAEFSGTQRRELARGP